MSSTSPHRFVGGMRYGNRNATWPFAELLLEQGAARIQLRGRLMRQVFRRPLPSIEVPIASATVVRLRMRRGLRFNPGDGTAPVIFWYFGEHRRLLELLERQGAQTESHTVEP